MPYSRNEVDLIGHVGNIEIKTREGNGKEFAVVSIATSDRWKKDGETQEKTSWHRVVVFSPRTVKFISDYLKKGRYVNVRGALDYYDYEDESGNKTYVTQIICRQLDVLDRKKDDGEPDAPNDDNH